MCGRFTQKSERPEIDAEFYVTEWLSDVNISYNIAPSHNAGVIIRKNNKTVYTCFKWGLVPRWVNDPYKFHGFINAKAETVAVKPSFRASFENKRCIIPADGFFEWKIVNKEKIPYYVRFKNSSLMSFAGLWEECKTTGQEKLYTFTIITTEANNLMADIHDKKRMPVIIDKENRDIWLNNNESDTKKALKLLHSYNDDLIEAWPVSKLVNSPLNNSPECIINTLL